MAALTTCINRASLTRGVESALTRGEGRLLGPAAIVSLPRGLRFDGADDRTVPVRVRLELRRAGIDDKATAPRRAEPRGCPARFSTSAACPADLCARARCQGGGRYICLSQHCNCYSRLCNAALGGSNPTSAPAGEQRGGQFFILDSNVI